VTAVAAGEAIITVNCDGYTASCVVTVTAPAGEPRDITTGVLTQAEMDALKNYVPEKSGTFSPIIKEAYAAANIDLAPVVGTDSWFTIKGILFDGAGNVVAGTTNYHKMLLDGYYGGVEGGTARTFTPADFKIGDVFAGAHNVGCSASGEAKKWVYITGVYIGDGKFMVSESHPAACTDTCSKSYVDTYGNANSAIWAAEDYMKTTYKFYFVLRPERLAVDAIQSISLDKATAELEAGSDVTLVVSKNPTTAADAITTTWTSSNTSVATVADGKVTAVAAGEAIITVNCDGYTASCAVTVTAPVSSEPREITSGALTKAEMDAIKAYVPAEVETVGPVLKGAYAAAGIDLAPAVGTDSFFNMQGKLFDTSTGLPLATQDATYAKMLLPGCYGGKRYSANSGEDGKTFTPADFKVGDVFIAAQDAACATGGARWVYVTGIYIGDGQFRISENHSHTNGTACNRIYISDYNADNAEKSVVWGDAAAMKLYRYYFVLRPERLAADAIQSVSLDVTELTLAAGLNRTLEVSVNPTAAVKPVTTTWTSSNTEVATVVDGKVTAVAAGTATITVNCDGYTASCTLLVKGATREITAGALTKGEMAAISSTGTDIFETYTSGPAISAVYDQAAIDLSSVYAKIGAGDLVKIVKGTKTNDTVKATYVADTYYGTESGNGTKAFVPADFVVGDILVANYKCTHNKWPTITAIYQGEGKFLVVRQPGSSGCTCSKEAHFDIYDAGGNHNADGHVSIWSEAKDAANDEGGAWLNYLVFRPSQLAD